MNLSAVSSWWKFPEFIEKKDQEEIDFFLRKISLFSEPHFSLDHDLKISRTKRKIENQVQSFFIIAAYDRHGSLVAKSEEIACAAVLSLSLSKSLKDRVCIVYTETFLGEFSGSKNQKRRNEVRLVVDLIKGNRAVLKSIKKPREKKFVDTLFSCKESLKEYHIHPISYFFQNKEENEIKTYFVQDYCPLGDLFEFLVKNPSLPVWKRLLFCMDVISSVAFLHQSPQWSYLSEGCGYFVKKTYHSDIKLENYLVQKIEDFSGEREALFLIDHEFVGNTSLAGTLRYFDPQKAQLLDLVDKRRKDQWFDLRGVKFFWENNFIKIRDLTVSYDRIMEMVVQFQEDFGQAHDIWALGLVLISIMTLDVMRACELSIYQRDGSVRLINQEEIDNTLKRIELSIVEMDWSLEIQRIFELIRGALTIDYAKRVDIQSMEKVAMRIQKMVEVKRKKEEALESLEALFRLEIA